MPKNVQTFFECTIALISYASKVMLKILQARLEQYVNRELSDVQAGFRLPAFAGSCRKQGNSRKTSTSALLTMLKPLIVRITRNWKTLKEMGIPDHLTCLPRNLYLGQEATVRTRHGTEWFKIGKGVRQGCILSSCLFNFYAEYIAQNAGLDESQARSKIAGRNINSPRYADDTPVMEEK